MPAFAGMTTGEEQNSEGMPRMALAWSGGDATDECQNAAPGENNFSVTHRFVRLRIGGAAPVRRARVTNRCHRPENQGIRAFQGIDATELWRMRGKP